MSNNFDMQRTNAQLHKFSFLSHSFYRNRYNCIIIYTISSIRKLSGAYREVPCRLTFTWRFYLSLYVPSHEKFFCSEISYSYRCLLGSFSSAKNHYRQFNHSIVIRSLMKVLCMINVCAMR